MPDQQEMTRYSLAEFTNGQSAVTAVRGACLAGELLIASGEAQHRELYRLVNDAGTPEVRCAAEYLALALFRMMTAVTDGDEERARAWIVDVFSGVT